MCAELFHVDRRKGRRIGMTKPIVAFRSFADAPKKQQMWSLFCSKTRVKIAVSEHCTICCLNRRADNKTDSSNSRNVADTKNKPNI